MRLGGARRFLTQKLSWNQYNDMPHHTFWWEGIDGSRVLTHFPPADTYGGAVSAHELRLGVANFRDHEHVNRSLYLFGYGDGGGGPTDAMLESARRLADSDGLPQLTMEGPRAFFDKVDEEIVEPAVWVGELYLEHHRGTYTSQAETKNGNRRGELALREAEAWSTIAAEPVDGDRLDAAWRMLLINQFHDIIPGSGIHWVYEDTRAELAEVRRTADEIADASRDRAVRLGRHGRPRVPSGRMELALTARDDLIEVDVPTGATVARGPDGVAVPLQPVGSGRAIFRARVPAFGYRTYDLVAGEPNEELAPAEAGPRRLANGILRVELDDNGLLSSIIDERVGRQVLAEGNAATCCSCTPTTPTSSTPGTSMPPTAGGPRTSSTSTRSRSASPGPCGPACASAVPSVRPPSSRP